jgi:hypothetical protein
MIGSVNGRPNEGDIVEVFGPLGEYIGYVVPKGVCPDTTNPYDIVTWEELEAPYMGYRVLLSKREYEERICD